MTRKISTVVGRVAAGLAALSMVAATTAASAQSRYYRDHHRGNGNTETAIVAGVVGLALGAAIAGNSHDRYDNRYDNRYDRRGYDYAPPPPPPPRYGYGYGYAPRYNDYRRSDCWVTRDYDRRSGTVYERTVCR